MKCDRCGAEVTNVEGLVILLGCAYRFCEKCYDDYEDMFYDWLRPLDAPAEQSHESEA